MLKRIFTYTLLTSLLLNTGCSTIPIKFAYELENKNLPSSHSIDDLLLKSKEEKLKQDKEIKKEQNNSVQKKLRIIIDPGHGPYEISGQLGAKNYKTKTDEFYLNLVVAKKLTDLLNQDPRFQVDLTKDSTKYNSYFETYMNDPKVNAFVNSRYKIKHDIPKLRSRKGKKSGGRGLSYEDLTPVYITRIAGQDSGDVFLSLHFDDVDPKTKQKIIKRKLPPPKPSYSILVSPYFENQADYDNSVLLMKYIGEEFSLLLPKNPRPKTDQREIKILEKKGKIQIHMDFKEISAYGGTARGVTATIGDKRIPNKIPTLLLEQNFIDNVDLNDDALNKYALAVKNAFVKYYVAQLTKQKLPIYTHLPFAHLNNNFINP